jgi:hypothetical protein
MRRALPIAILAVMLAAGVWWRLHPAHPPAVQASLYETDMVEGLVRGILTEMKPNGPPVCFLAFGDGETAPSRAFLGRFDESEPKVRGCGAAASPPVGRHFEFSTGQPGLEIHIIRFKEIVPWSFEVLVRFSNLPAGRDRFSYRVTRQANEWKIQSRKAV